jgi:FtsP/CotA-like multicopper oxidase with cupredoxin domain
MFAARRQFLKAAGAGGFGLLAPLGLAGIVAADDSTSWFRNPLRLPPVQSGQISDDERVIDLSLGYGTSEFLGGRPTPTAGINGAYLGPVVRVRQGDKVRLKVTNRLSEPSTLHWHGLNLPAVMDGGPHQVIHPGKTWVSAFEIRQGASTQWYHSHMYHRTGIQVYYGLAGLFYIDDPRSDALDLPSEYGVDDIPLVLQDRSFNEDGSFRYASSMHDRMMGMMGQFMLVNGTAFARLQVQRQLTRLRLLNGSNARIYNLEFADGREFQQIATDGGLLQQPVPMRSIVLSPGERAEILVEFSAGDDVMLRHKSLPVRSGSGSATMGMMGNMMAANDRPFDIMRFDAAQVKPGPGRIPARLVAPRDWAPADAVRRRQFRLNMRMGMGMMRGGGFGINGRPMDMKRIDARVPLGDIEIWEISNASPMAHPFHIHDTQFRILDRDGRPPQAGEQGLKDTVLVYPRETVRIIIQFENYADADTPYMFHCHILEHEDAGMMGQFVVVT